MFQFLAQADQGGFNLNNLIDTLARTPLSVVFYWTLLFSIVRIAAHRPLMKAMNLPAHRRAAGEGRGYKFLDEVMDALIYTAIFVFMLLRPFVFQTFNVPSGSMVSTLLVGDYIIANKAIYRYSDPKPGDIVVFRPPAIAVHPDQIDSDGQVKVDFVKRCIGVPGDLIEIHNHVLYRNGVKWDEPYRHLTMPEVEGQDGPYRERTPEEVKQLEPEDFKLVFYKNRYWVAKICGDLVNQYSQANTNPPESFWPKMSVADEFKLNLDEMATVKNLPAARVPKGYYLMMGDNRLYSYDGRAWGLVPRDEIVGRSEAIWMPISHWGRTPSNEGSPAK